MELEYSFSDANINEDLISSATSVDEIIGALAKRGCSNLTSSINLTTCGELPWAGGGFCDVFRGALLDGTDVAIKSLRVYDRPGRDDRRKILKRAARELYHWSKLRHRNVLPLMGLAIFRGNISMVSEWMENSSLMAFLRLNPDVDRIKLCMDVCDGLCYIHVNDMVHGDLKAANIMVSPDGTPLIADFGNAQLKDLTLKFTNTTQSSISLRWTAPELLLEDSGPQVSKQADVYAYGMTVLEMMTGEVPFEGTDDQKVLYLIVANNVPPRPDIGMHDDLWNMLNLCWDREPTRRPQITSIQYRLRTIRADIAHDVHLRALDTARKLATDGNDDEGERPEYVRSWLSGQDGNYRHPDDDGEGDEPSELETSSLEGEPPDYDGSLDPADPYAQPYRDHDNHRRATGVSAISIRSPSSDSNGSSAVTRVTDGERLNPAYQPQPRQINYLGHDYHGHRGPTDELSEFEMESLENEPLDYDEFPSPDAPDRYLGGGYGGGMYGGGGGSAEQSRPPSPHGSVSSRKSRAVTVVSTSDEDDWTTGRSLKGKPL